MGRGNRGGKRKIEIKQSRFKKSEPKQEPKVFKETYGGKVQQNFIDYVKRMINVDLTKARDTMFDDRKGFNIDKSLMNKTDYQNFLYLLNDLKKEKSNFNVQYLENGVTRYYIKVTEKVEIKPKKTSKRWLNGEHAEP